MNSIDADGTKMGYDIPLMEAICDCVQIPVIASGGAGEPRHLAEVLKHGPQAALIASIVHYGQYSIAECKRVMAESGLCVRIPW